MNQPRGTPESSADKPSLTAPAGVLADPLAAAAPPVSQLMARDAIGLLTEDHRKAQLLLADYLALASAQADPAEKFAVARQVCGDLLIHMAIEEAVFYPRVREALPDDRLADEAKQEHDAAKESIRRIGEIDPSDPRFDASMQQLATEILAHVEHEETIVFPQMLMSRLDLDAIGNALLEAKTQMRVSLGLEPE